MRADFKRCTRAENLRVTWKALGIEGLKLHPTYLLQNLKKEYFTSRCNEIFVPLGAVLCFVEAL